MVLSNLQMAIGYHFKDLSLLERSLTHASYAHEHNPDRPPVLCNNERLEFLGDAVLSLTIARILYDLYPMSPEGQLTRLRAELVSEKTLAKVGQQIGLHPYIRLGKGETRTGGARKPSIVSSGFEALMAAIYVDGGYHAVYPVVRYLFSSFLKQGMVLMDFCDYKTQLQELVQQACYGVTPLYRLEGTYGLDHERMFEVSVSIKDRVITRAKGASKKEAEQLAAKLAIKGRHTWS